MKKLLIFMMSFVFLLSSAPLKAQAKADPPTVSADSVVLMDAITGYVLYGKNENSAYPPASTTKLMTALLTLEKCKLDDVVTVGKNPPIVDGSKIYLFEGEQLKVRDLLYGLMLQSGNDCAEALAEHVGGSIDNFAVLMNKRALELGCKNSNFVNPSGLYNEKHKTSAKDLALIMRELSNKPEYTQIASTSFYEIPPTNKSAVKRPLWNENKLIQKSSQLYYDGCQGGKTGYTTQSEHSYVSYATRNGQKLIVALVHDKNKTFFPDAVNLFNYGFSTFESVLLYKKGDLVTTYNNNGVTVPLLAASNFYYVKLKEDTSPAPKFVLKDENLSVKFFKTGDTIAEGTVVKNNENLGTLKLTSGTSHELKQVLQSSPFKSMNVKMEYLIPGVLIIIGGAIFMFKKYKLFNKLFNKE